MKRTLYLLELIDYDYYDESEKEDVEERYIIGYFSSINVLERVISLCERRKEKNEKIKVTKKVMECGHNQKYVYILFYEYSVLNGEEYSDYYEYFDPQSSYEKCNIQKRELIKNDRYKKVENRIFDNSVDGFHIEKIKIDYISHINYKMDNNEKI